MAIYSLDSDCPPLFMGSNYFWWQESLKLYVKRKYINLWEIIKKGPIVIEKSKDQFTNEDYNMMSKTFIAINMLCCGLSIDNCEYAFQYKMGKEIWDCLHYSYGANEKVLDLDIVTQEETTKINMSKLQSPGDGNNSCETDINENVYNIIQNVLEYHDKIEQHKEFAEKQDHGENGCKKNYQ